MQKNKIKTYVLKYSRTELKQGRGENVGKKVRSPKDYWMVKYKYTDKAGENHETTKRGFKTKQEADAFADSIKENFIVPDKLTMNQLFDIWFEDYQSGDDLADNTIKWHYYNLLHLRKGLGVTLVQDLDLPDINAFFGSLKKTDTEKGLSTTSIHNIRRTLNQALDFAVEEQYISVNPLKARKRKRNTKKVISQQNQFKPKVISQARIIEMIESISDPVMALVVALAGLRGLRRGEIRGLLWEDVDLKKKILYVRKQLCGNAKERSIPKTVSSIRTIGIPNYILDLFQQVDEFQRNAMMAFGEDKFNSGYVIAHIALEKHIGKPYSANYYSERFLQVLKENGLEQMRLHDLRHSFGSNLLYQRIPIPTISKLMGHASVAVTLKIYAHEIEELMAMDEEKINLEIEETLSYVRNSANSEY